MVTIIVIAVLVVLALGAVALIPLMNASTRKGRLATPAGPTPLPGSPAEVWCARGERVLGELRAKLAEAPALDTVSADASQVVAELRMIAGQVAELDRGLAQIPTPELEQQRDRLAGQLGAASPGEDIAATRDELTRSYQAVTARLGIAQRQRVARDALLARMESAVQGLEQARDEVVDLIVEGARTLPDTGTDARLELSERLTGLRAGLAEVRELTNPDVDPPRGGGEDRGQP
ncbi:MAG: hypothetical protein GEU98_01290 [Pseudonocardiaceae bacterium]|nr:hypothetical protein [Pseudonocardiaceae bacterium]